MTYRTSFTCPDGAKARIRTVLKLMGAEHIRITEEQTQEAAKPKPDNLPTTEEAKAVATLFKRKPETPWAQEEIKAFRAAVKTGLLTLETMNLVTDYYRTERKRDGNFCRTSILTFCRHFGTELDKARAGKPVSSKKGEWLDSTSKIIPLHEPEVEEEIRAKAKQVADEFRKEMRG